MNFDQAAVKLLLSSDPKKAEKLQALAKRASDIVHNRATCPDCGNEGPHDDNGLSPSHPDFSLCCTACGCQFEVR